MQFDGGMSFSGGVEFIFPAQWAVSNTNPVVAWSNPNNANQQFFAIPTNGTSITSWQGSDGSNTYSLGAAYVVVSRGVLFNGVTYKGYVRSTTVWTKGNSSYQISISTTEFGSKSSNDITALNNLVYTGPYN